MRPIFRSSVHSAKIRSATQECRRVRPAWMRCSSHCVPRDLTKPSAARSATTRSKSCRARPATSTWVSAFSTGHPRVEAMASPDFGRDVRSLVSAAGSIATILTKLVAPANHRRHMIEPASHDARCWRPIAYDRRSRSAGIERSRACRGSHCGDVVVEANRTNFPSVNPVVDHFLAEYQRDNRAYATVGNAKNSAFRSLRRDCRLGRDHRG